MTQARLNHVLVLNVYKDLASNINLRVIAQHFIEANDSQRALTGAFQAQLDTV
jgi:hypothetical protein